MKKIIGVIGVLLLILSCSGNKTSKEQMLGNDRDKNNCIGSAGYQWSQLKKECIRPFEVGVKLNSITNSNTACYILIDKDKIEVFSAEIPGSEVLQKQTNNTWKNGIWELTNNNGKYIVKKQGAIVYTN